MREALLHTEIDMVGLCVSLMLLVCVSEACWRVWRACARSSSTGSSSIAGA